MKSTIISATLAVILGVLMGMYIFNQYNETKPVTNIIESKNLFFLQYGVYQNVDNAKKNAKGLDLYLISHLDQYYRIYIGITSDEEYAKKLGEIYSKKGKDTYIRSIVVSNNEFLNRLIQYEVLLNNNLSDDEILKVEKEILDEYKELVEPNVY